MLSLNCYTLFISYIKLWNVPVYPHLSLNFGITMCIYIYTSLINFILDNRPRKYVHMLNCVPHMLKSWSSVPQIVTLFEQMLFADIIS